MISLSTLPWLDGMLFLITGLVYMSPFSILQILSYTPGWRGGEDLTLLPKEGKVCLRAKWPIRSVLNSSFCSMKGLAILLFPPGWDASPSQGYPQHYDHPYSFIHLGEERQWGIKLLVEENNMTTETRLKLSTFRSEVQRANHSLDHHASTLRRPRKL